MSLTVDLHVEENQSEIPLLSDFQQWVDMTVKHCPSELPQYADQVCIRIVNKTESQTLNHQFLQKDKPTNVLSFPNEVDLHQTSIGDIAICDDIVKAEAKTRNISSKNHYAHLTAHGVLHLLGYDHVLESDAIIMENIEIAVLAALHIDNPYEESLHHD